MDKIEFSKAILIDEEGIKDKIFRSYYDQSIEKLLSLSGGNLLFYDWNANNHTVKFAEKNKFPEKPSDIVFFLKPYGRFELNPAFDITTDTTGKTTSAQFILESEMAGYPFRTSSESCARTLPCCDAYDRSSGHVLAIRCTGERTTEARHRVMSTEL